jgi:steroid 5-alpha reductase family enzyme
VLSSLFVTTSLLAGNALAVFAMVTALWLWSVYRRDASIIDPWWSMGFLLVTARTAFATGVTPAKTLLLAMVAVWALRLFGHLTVRARGAPEDPRYQAFRRRFGAERYWWVSYFQVFLLQGVLVLLVSAPLQLAASYSAPDSIASHDLAALAVFTVGFLFEAVGDWQLARFRRDPASKGRALDTGLWRYTRHPNYFGEAVLQWGLWLTALDQPWGPAAALAPALMTWLLLRVSGVTMLERQLTKTRPAYEDYVRRTSAFLPWPPRAR